MSTPRLSGVQTDGIGSYKSNNHTITTTAVPRFGWKCFVFRLKIIHSRIYLLFVLISSACENLDIKRRGWGQNNRLKPPHILVAVLFFHYNIASIPLTFLAHGRWFSPGTPASSTTKTGRHDIDEILLKVALNTKNQSINLTFLNFLTSLSCLLPIALINVINEMT